MLLGVMIFLWLLLFMIPKIPSVQVYLGETVSSVLSEKLGTKVIIGNVDIRLPDRIVIENVLLYDKSRKKMLCAGRIAVGIDILPLLDGKIRISSAQLFATRIVLYQKDAASPLNCQFVIDSLKSKDTTTHTPLDLAITSLVIRNSAVTYDRQSSPLHLHFTRLTSDIALNALTDDSLDVRLKNFSGKEKSGLFIKQLSASVQTSKNMARVYNLYLRLPQSKIRVDGYMSPLTKEEGKGSVVMKGRVTPSDFACLIPELSHFDRQLHIHAIANGTAKNLKASLTAKSSDRSLDITAQAKAYDILDDIHGTLNLSKTHISQNFIRSLSAFGITIPQQILNLGDINISGQCLMANKNTYKGNADVTLSEVGKAAVRAAYHDKSLQMHIQTPGLALRKITSEEKLGNISCNVDLKIGDVGNIRKNISAKGTISELTYNNYTYHNITVDGTLQHNSLRGSVAINDPNIELNAKGSGNIERYSIDVADVTVRNFYPRRLNITNIFGETPLNADIHITPVKTTVNSDIVDITMDGRVHFWTIPYSISNIVGAQIPSAPALPKRIVTHNNFSINTNVKDVAVLSRILKKEINAPEGIMLNGFVNDDSHTADLTLDVPDLTIDGKHLLRTKLHFFTPEDAVQAILTTSLQQQDSRLVDLSLDCKGKDNTLNTILSWDTKTELAFKGSIFANTQFGNTTLPLMSSSTPSSTAVSLVIPHSEFQVGDSIWSVQANRILYDRGTLAINNLLIGNSDQKIYVNGNLSSNSQDSLAVDLSNVDVSYILNLVDFHSVDFNGMASGHFVCKNLFGDINTHGYLDVSCFQFEHGNMGDLHVNANFDPKSQRILIDAVAKENIKPSETIITGYIDPSGPDDGLDLDIRAHNTRLEFMQSFCGSFMKDAKLFGTGNVRLFGPFSNINITGSLAANGDFTVTPTNCTYTLKNDTVVFVPDDIQFKNFTLYDKLGNTASVRGGIHHKHLTRMSYDIDVKSRNFLAYDFPTLNNDETFCGHAVIKGDIGIHGKGNELVISADATPLNGSYFTYNASSPDAIRNGEIITWRSISQSDSLLSKQDTESQSSTFDAQLNAGNDRTNMHFSFMIHANEDARLNLLMDPVTGDYINIFGNGDLRVDYYNKGGLNIFGNYEVDHGTYKMTLQNIIRRDFSFRKGGTISFGGDPYNAIINMNAVYSLNSVPLSDLNIGTNFSTTNVPVNCLMTISGTPGKPHIAFGVELPTLSTNARQMVNSVINSEEEMNQQVLYLLAIGRFYAPSSTTSYANASSNSTTPEVSQSSLAIQSFLSGTLSQSFNNMMSGVMGRLNRSGNNLSFGANIAPGDQGFTNAEYEGLLSGNFFNNRLLFTGQFGYRDHVTTNTSSFIGDFSLQYVLTKNGVMSLKVYNQSNDRYFTRNALNTQGIGLVFQKEWGK